MDSKCFLELDSRIAGRLHVGREEKQESRIMPKFLSLNSWLAGHAIYSEKTQRRKKFSVGN